MTELSPERRVERIRERINGRGSDPELAEIAFLLDTLEAALQREAKLREALREIAEGAYTWDEHLEIANAALSDQPTERVVDVDE